MYDTSDKPHVCVQGVAQVALTLSFASKSITPFDPREHGDESQDAKMCKLQEVWATSKGPLCEILLAVFRSQLKIEGQRIKWEPKRQPTERGELKRQSRGRGKLKRQSRERWELKRQSRERGESEDG